MQIVKEPPPGPELDCEVFCVDTGLTIHVPARHLLILPPEAQSWPRHCIEIILTNLLPHANGNNEYFQNGVKFCKSQTEGKTWHGKVLLAIRNTVWVNPMIQFEKDPMTGHSSQGCNLACELVSGQHANILDMHNHMMIMMEHIRKGVPDYPEILHELNNGGGSTGSEDNNQTGENESQLKCGPNNWLYFNNNPYENQDEGFSIVQALIMSWVNPGEIYVRPVIPNIGEDASVLLKTQQRALGQLETEITNYIEDKLQQGKCSNSNTSSSTTNDEDIIIGSVVAVKIRNDPKRWVRGVVVDKVQCKMGNNIKKFDVFLVDYGVTRFNVLENEEMVGLVGKLVTALPFQVICLKLGHVQPLSRANEWDVDAIIEFGKIIRTDKARAIVSYRKLNWIFCPKTK